MLVHSLENLTDGIRDLLKNGLSVQLDNVGRNIHVTQNFYVDPGNYAEQQRLAKREMMRMARAFA